MVTQQYTVSDPERLFDITAELVDLQRQMADNPDQIDEILDNWIKANAKLSDKIDAYAEVYRSGKLRAKLYDSQNRTLCEEAEVWRGRRDAQLAMCEKLKERLMLCMDELELTEVKGTLHWAKIQENSADGVIVPGDLTKLPFQYLKLEAKKTAIAKAIESGEDVPGCSIKRGRHLRFY